MEAQSPVAFRSPSVSVPFTEIQHCRVCRSTELQPVFDLGRISLSGFINPSEANVPPLKAPLTLVQCRKCYLVQLLHSVHPDMMFSQYWYRSSTNEMMRGHLNSFVRDVITRFQPQHGDVWLDIGCNDGYMLSQVPDHLIRVGMDPAEVQPLPDAMDVWINDYFSVAKYKAQLVHHQATIITAVAMFYDVESPVTFLRDCYRALTPEGVLVLEMHYLMEMVQKLTFDAICHEHLTYWSMIALEYAATEAGFIITDATVNPANGGSLRVFLRKGGYQSSFVRKLAADEIRYHERLLREFPEKVGKIGSDLGRQLDWIRRNDFQVIGYGASTKGNTLLEYFKLTSMDLPLIADRQESKWGLQTAGTRIPIISEAAMRVIDPDFLLALPYHFIDAFLQREAELIAKGTKFIVPIPSLRILP